MSIKELKELSKEEFMKLCGAPEDLYTAIQNSKSGWIKVSRDYDGAGDCGITEAFGEGISCKISNCHSWYVTSVIQSIDWENHTFKTLNSTYNFEFKSDEELKKEMDSETNLI